LGDQHVKNIDEPVRAFAVLLWHEPSEVPQVEEKVLASPDRPCVGVLPFNFLAANRKAALPE
jgi:hypothetical protein